MPGKALVRALRPLGEILVMKQGLAADTGFPYGPLMSDRFDPDKDAINRERHGLSLTFGDRIMDDEGHLIIPSIRPQDGEERFKAVGCVEGKLYTAVFTWRNDGPRFISVRRSNAGEERAYRSGL